MAEAPTYYNVGHMNGNGLLQADVHKAIYNFYKALYAICYNLDEDNGTLGTDYLANIGTDLATAMAKLGTPSAAGQGTT